VESSLTDVPDRELPSWYRFSTRCTVLSVQIVHGAGHIGNDGRSGTHRHLNLLGWGPKGRWFKSSRPALHQFRGCVPGVPIVPAAIQSAVWSAALHGKRRFAGDREILRGRCRKRTSRSYLKASML
jgi:hypothetical protein